MYRISTSASKRLVANVCLNKCGVMCISIAARVVYLLSILRTAWSVKGLPDWFAKKWLQFSISRQNSFLYSIKILITEMFPIWIIRSLLPLPYISMLPLYKLISFVLNVQSSDILMPVANSSSMMATSLKESLFGN